MHCHPHGRFTTKCKEGKNKRDFNSTIIFNSFKCSILFACYLHLELLQNFNRTSHLSLHTNNNTNDTLCFARRRNPSFPNASHIIKPPPEIMMIPDGILEGNGILKHFFFQNSMSSLWSSYDIL